jgi:hypothetical protein
MDELFEALTLIQTGKVRHFPVVLVGSAYWGGLLDWARGTLLAHGTISPADLELVQVTDDPDEVVAIMLRYSDGDDGHDDADAPAEEHELR